MLNALILRKATSDSVNGSSVQPIASNEFYDAEGELVESSTAIGLGELASRLASRAEADDSYARASFDLLSGTFVKSEPIARYASQEVLDLEITATGGELIDLPTSGAQRFQRTSAKSARVDVRLTRGSIPEEDDEASPRWLKPNELIDSDSDEVRALLAQAKLEHVREAIPYPRMLYRLYP